MVARGRFELPSTGPKPVTDRVFLRHLLVHYTTGLHVLRGVWFNKPSLPRLATVHSRRPVCLAKPCFESSWSPFLPAKSYDGPIFLVNSDGSRATECAKT